MSPHSLSPYNLLPQQNPNASSLAYPVTQIMAIYVLLTLYFIADAEDESLQRYKESLGLGGGGQDLSDPTDPRDCIILTLEMNSEGRPPVKLELSTPDALSTLKDHPFKIKEGSKFNLTATFKVQHNVLSGLQYVQVIKRKGIRIDKLQEMIGSYAPNTDKNPVHTKRFADEDAPSGMMARGHYTAISTFVDDDKKKHLEFEWSFDIAKDW
ncbi:Rho GDP-dissociation inhibitor [Botrytis cinerea]